MPPAAPPSGGEQNTGYMGPVWIVVGLFVLCFGIWYFAHTQIISAFFVLKNAEITIVQFFSHSLTQVQQYIAETPANQVGFSDAAQVASTIGRYWQIPTVSILLLFALILFFKSSASRYRQIYNMQSLKKLESQNWPQINPILNINLVDIDIDKGPWAMAMQPMYFAKKHKLLKEIHHKRQQGQLTKESAGISASLLKSKASRIFTMQLGKVWHGIDELPDHIKALFATFAARAVHDTKISQYALIKISASAKNLNSINFSPGLSILDKYKNRSEIITITKRHGYVMTVMASMLEAAREDGVLSSADFLWLKPIDRRLWFMLNSIGRQTSVIEVAGPFAHWIAEKELGRQLKAPMVEEATKALEKAISNIVYNPYTEF